MQDPPVNPLSEGRQAREDRQRALLEAQFQALQSGHPELAPRSSDELADQEVSYIEQLRRKAVQTVQQRQAEAIQLQLSAQAVAAECLGRGEVLEGYKALRSHLAALEQSDPEQSLSEALSYAQKLLERSGATLTPQQRPCAVKLLWLALEVGLRVPYAVTGQRSDYVHFHARQYELQQCLFPEHFTSAKALETAQDAAEQALRRTLNALEVAGILTRRRHIGNARDRRTGHKLPWSDGTLFKFCLKPGANPPRLRFAELTTEYTDLERETAKHWTLRRTGAASLLRQRVEQHVKLESKGAMSETETNSSKDECKLLKQLLRAIVKSIPVMEGVRFFVTDNPLAELLQTVGRVKKAPLEARAAWVAEGSRKLALLISDEGSVGHWAMVLWRAYQANVMGRDLLGLLAQGCKTMFEAQGRFYIRSPGAWLRTWLRRNGGAELVVKMSGQYPWQNEAIRLRA